MTIYEAIEYAKDQQEIFGGKHKEFLTNVAEWLEEFKNIIQWKSDVMEDFCKYDASSINEIVNNARNKAINEFAERLKEEISYRYGTGEINCAYNAKEKTIKIINQIAEEMRGGENEIN